jgi:hypothetical protein
VDPLRVLQALTELNSTQAIDEPSLHMQVALAVVSKALSITSQRHRDATGLVMKAIASTGGGRAVLNAPSESILAVARTIMAGKLPRKWKFARRAKHARDLLASRTGGDRSRSIGRLLFEEALHPEGSVPPQVHGGPLRPDE